jgi:hypothetical protein
VTTKLWTLLAVTSLALGAAGCSTTENANVSANANTNANSNVTVASDTTRPAADDSEITTSVDANGTRTETRVFHNNPRVAKVVVTTRNGQKTTTVYAPSGESKDIKDEVGDALTSTGNTLADAAGFVAAKTGDVVDKTKEGTKTAVEKTTDKAETVGEKTKEGAKSVIDKTKEGAKKTTNTVKKAIP